MLAMRAPRFTPFVIGLLASLAPGQEFGLPDESFIRTVRPILDEACVRCHGQERQRRGLRLDSLAAIRHGGQAGAILVPGDPDASLVLAGADRVDVDHRHPDRTP